MGEPSLRVICLCAEWCETCRTYRSAFYALAARFPDAEFSWLDVEYDAERVGELEVENFPTVRIERRAGADAQVLFFGVLQPHPEHLARLLEKLVSA